ncbi:MAG: hypothetical protein MUF78_04985 [Candidatus Edwardsbacteria bacterium]|jgi:hypothetical protein|nr:hypothetical protein [Candidatus Edwardsbacteria bacterium]
MKRASLSVLLVLCTGMALAQKSDPVSRLLRGISVGNPIIYRGLAVFPLSGQSASRLNGCRTLSQAMDRGYITVSEKDGGEVNRLFVENSGPSLVFLMAGELLAGCKQDRMVGDDCLLPPRSGRIPLTAYCVEHGRWTEQGHTFKAVGAAVQPGMRKVAKESRDQHAVWGAVASQYQAQSVPMSATGTYRSVVDDKEVARKREAYVERFAGVPSLGRGVCGCAVAIGGRIVCVDVVATPELFSALWPALAASYAMDAMGSDAGRATVGRSDIADFLRDAARCGMDEARTDGVGTAYEIRSRELYGSALVYRGDVVHCDLFPDERAGGGQDEGGAPKLQYRREHLRER